MGDARHTLSDIAKAQKLLNYKPQTSLIDGLAKEWIWTKSLYS